MFPFFAHAYYSLFVVGSRLLSGFCTLFCLVCGPVGQILSHFLFSSYTAVCHCSTSGTAYRSYKGERQAVRSDPYCNCNPNPHPTDPNPYLKAASQLVTRSTRHRSTRHPVDSSRSRLITKRRSTRHKQTNKQTSKPYCRSSIITGARVHVR